MMIRSILLAIAAAWFLYHALTLDFAGAMVATPDGGTAWDPASALVVGLRLLFAGLAIVCAAFIDWDLVEARLKGK
jgi:hypothetical protein